MSHRYFQVSYLTKDGALEQRLLFHATRAEVRNEIAEAGGIVQSIRERRRAWYNREYYPRRYKETFLRSLSFYVRGGGSGDVSAGQALQYVIENEQQSAKRADMQPVLDTLKRGGGFGEAVALLPFLDRSLITLLQAGDATGNMHQTIMDALALLENRNGTWKQVGAVVGWLAIDLSTMVSTVYAIPFAVIPWLRSHAPVQPDKAKAAEYLHQLDMGYQFGVWLTIFTTLVAFVAIAGLGAMYFGNAATKDWINERIVRVPMLRKLFIDGALSDGFLLLSRMAGQRIPLMRSLSMLTAFSSIHAVSAFWSRVEASVYAGWKVSHAFQEGGLLTPAEMHVLAAHQNAGDLSLIMEAMSHERREEAKIGVRQFIRISLVGCVLYIGVVMAYVIWLGSAQDSSISSSLDSIMQGGF